MATAAKKPVRRATKTAAKPAATAKAKTGTVDAASASAGVNDAAFDQMDSFFGAFNDNAEMLREQAEDVMGALRDNMETATNRMQSVNAELIAAAREEITDAVDFANELSRATSITDAMEIQRDYWTNLFETRTERARALAQTSADAARDVVEPLTETMSASFKNNPFEKLFPFPGK
ncbi:MAG: phasin family protein [Pseudomonadota bacterium]